MLDCERSCSGCEMHHSCVCCELQKVILPCKKQQRGKEVLLTPEYATLMNVNMIVGLFFH